MQIRRLDPIADRDLVAEMYENARDYWSLDRAVIDTAALATAFFAEAPPTCDPTASHHLGLFIGPRLAGIAELSFGFPEPDDAYLGTMIFADWARSQGYGAALLHEVETRAKGRSRLYLGVLDSNPKGRAFWLRHGFTDTGVSRLDTDNGVTNTIRRLGKSL